MSGAQHRDDTGAKLGMWLFLFTELILFGGLFILYAVYLNRYPEDFAAAGREMNVIFGTANTVILLTSSLAVAMATSAIQRGQKKLTLGLLAATIGSALIFLVNKYFEWSHEIHRGFYPNSPTLNEEAHGKIIFFGLYYFTTGLHGLHVILGGALLAWVMIKVARGSIDHDNVVPLENSGLYWHLVDLVWIFIFPLYYLIL